MCLKYNEKVKITNLDLVLYVLCIKYVLCDHLILLLCCLSDIFINSYIYQVHRLLGRLWRNQPRPIARDKSNTRRISKLESVETH